MSIGCIEAPLRDNCEWPMQAGCTFGDEVRLPVRDLFGNQRRHNRYDLSTR